MPSSRRKPRVLVMGAGGFIGSAMVSRLLSAGMEVHAAVRENAPAGRLNKKQAGLQLHVFDVTNARSVMRLVESVVPWQVIHLAGPVDTRREAQLFESMLNGNVHGTWHVLEALRQHPPESSVFISSSEEYGDSAVPFSEEKREEPVSPYSWSKMAATHLIQTYHRLYGLRVAVVRCSVAYGPGQDNNQFIPAQIRACFSGQSLPMTKGEQTRDFLFIDDLVEGMMAALSSPSALGEVINLSCGIEVRLKDVAMMIVRLTNASVSPQLGALPYREHELMRHCCPNTKAKRLLNWSPTTSLEEGLMKTIAWYVRHNKANRTASMARR